MTRNPEEDTTPEQKTVNKDGALKDGAEDNVDIQHSVEISQMAETGTTIVTAASEPTGLSEAGTAIEPSGFPSLATPAVPSRLSEAVTGVLPSGLPEEATAVVPLGFPTLATASEPAGLIEAATAAGPTGFPSLAAAAVLSGVPEAATAAEATEPFDPAHQQDEATPVIQLRASGPQPLRRPAPTLDTEPLLTHREKSMVARRERGMKPNTAEISFPSNLEEEASKENAGGLQREQTRTRLPPQIIKMSTVSMATKPRNTTPGVRIHSRSNHNYIETRNHKKVIAWDEATNSRPPLRIDMEGPTPWSYSPHNKPLYETNSPAWSFGRKTYVEKAGGSRTSWEKTWFQSSHLWHQKTDFHSDRTQWPSPSHYTQQPSLGPKQVTNTAFPAFSIGIRRLDGFSKKGCKDEPSPNEYESWKSDVVLARRAPSFTHGLRRGGTVLWPSSEGHYNPGPGAYMPELGYTRQHQPSFTIRGVRRDKTHQLGPFATF